VTFFAPHFGHGGGGLVERVRNSSNRSSQASQRYSYTGMPPDSSPIESTPTARLRDSAAAQGVHPSDEDLEGVRDFLDRILPALAEIEERLPPELEP
jgi:hypothetical protein